MATKWNSGKAIASIQEYKTHECLWNFQSPQYKNKQLREAAYKQFVDAMDITGFAIPEVKNKIKSLGSTYAQEMKKIRKSKNFGAGVGNIYESNIQWMKELQPVYRDTHRKKTLDNVINFIIYSVTCYVTIIETQNMTSTTLLNHSILPLNITIMIEVLGICSSQLSCLHSYMV
jgi:formamidopyrimidine-DNA glycosylase